MTYRIVLEAEPSRFGGISLRFKVRESDRRHGDRDFGQSLEIPLEYFGDRGIVERMLDHATRDFLRYMRKAAESGERRLVAEMEAAIDEALTRARD